MADKPTPTRDPLQAAIDELSPFIPFPDGSDLNAQNALATIQREHKGHPEIYLNPKFALTDTLGGVTNSPQARVRKYYAQKFIFLRRAEDYARAWQETGHDLAPFKTREEVAAYCAKKLAEAKPLAPAAGREDSVRDEKAWDDWRTRNNIQFLEVPGEIALLAVGLPIVSPDLIFGTYKYPDVADIMGEAMSEELEPAKKNFTAISVTALTAPRLTSLPVS